MGSVRIPFCRKLWISMCLWKIYGLGVILLVITAPLGCSPDDGLSYIYGIWGLRHVIPESRKESTYADRSRSRRRVKSPMAM